jgi:hypothetical protein
MNYQNRNLLIDTIINSKNSEDIEFLFSEGLDKKNEKVPLF